MIRRDDGENWLLIEQTEHARLAAEIAAAWGNGVVSPLPVRDLLIPAIRHHDDGWQDWAVAPGIDPGTGKPRNFTEMPMAVSTALWNKSIGICREGFGPLVTAIQRFRPYLQQHGKRWMRERSLILAEVFEGEFPFDHDYLIKRLSRHRVSRSTIFRTLELLIRAGLLQQSTTTAAHTVFKVVTPLRPSPLGALWVSQHFCWLAEKARNTRSENEEDLKAIERFLDEQSALQIDWEEEEREQAVELVFMGPNRFDSLIETGFRYVQFFDALSLWFCCAPLTEPFETQLPDGGNSRWSPSTAANGTVEIAVDPYPLSVDRLELTVSCRVVPARTYTDDADLQNALQTAPHRSLSWNIVR